MRSVILLLLFTIPGLFAGAQMLSNELGEAFTDTPFFNTDFIARNHIHRLKGEFIYKKQGEMMQPTTFYYVYEFDSLGRLVLKYETRTDDGTRDTTFMQYAYSGDELAALTTFDREGKTSYRYTLDDGNHRVAESIVRTFYADSLHPSREIVLNKETMTWQLADRQAKKTVYNSYGLPYKEVFYYYDERGYLSSREEFLMTTSERTIYTYEYNEKGYLAALKRKKAGSDSYEEELRFRYDEYGNLIEKHLYKEGIFTTDTQFLYNEKSRLLNAILIREVKTNFILILRFKEYDYFN